MELKAKLRTIPDYPKEGIEFYDITTLLKDGEAFNTLIEEMASSLNGKHIDFVLGIEARGFIIGAALACKIQAGFIPARKPGKLPCETKQREYSLEYGTDIIEIHKDAIPCGARVLIADDLLATGGTALAAAQLVEDCGGHVSGLRFAIELCSLAGRERLKGYEVRSIIEV